MEARLAESARCRLCAAPNAAGTPLYEPEAGGARLADRLNAYLPLQVEDDGKYSRTICPGCHIQLEATIEFFDLIIKGQQIMRELLQKEKQAMKNSTVEVEYILENGLFTPEQSISLQMAGLEKPKRKRGRPKKVPKPEMMVSEAENCEQAQEEGQLVSELEETPEASGKRRRKAPQRFREAVQGKELERIFREEGVIEGEESDSEKKDSNAEPTVNEDFKPDEVIGHLQTTDGKMVGEPILITKGKGRGRPKGAKRVRPRSTKHSCAICGMEFTCRGRYMSHIARHGHVQYQCAECDETFGTRLDFNQHQDNNGHLGQKIIQNDQAEQDTKTQTQNESVPSFVSLLISSSNTELPKSMMSLEEGSPAQLVPTEGTDSNVESSDIATVYVTGEPTPQEPCIEATVQVRLKEELNLKNEPMDYIVEVNCESNSQEKSKPKEKKAIDRKKAKHKCPHCDRVFTNKQNKFVHVRSVHKGERPYSCKECNATFPYARSLKLHKATHMGQGYACDLCGKVLNHPSSVVYHKEAEHMGHKFECIKCGKLFKHRQLLQRHQIVHSELRPYTCKVCMAAFKTKANLVNHQNMHDGVKKFTCTICGSAYSQKTSLNLHMRRHTGVRPFGCSTCGKTFNQRSNLSEHLRTHSGEKPYKCPLCSRRFTTSSQCRLHVRRHTGDKPFSCPHCAKRFLSRDSWRQHMAREMGQLDYWCTICGRGFAERWAMAKHQRCHTGEKPFNCNICPRKFSDSSNLAKHKKIHRSSTSLLVQNKLVPEPETPGEGAVEAEAEAEAGAGDEERVIYVAYSVDDDGANTHALHILDPEQAESLDDSKVMTCDLYEDDSLLVDGENAEQILEEPCGMQEAILEDLDESLDEVNEHGHMSVIDEHGNPIHFTMQDGTRLAITTTDGKSLQVTTHDGQTIPVELNDVEETEMESEQPDGLSLECAVEAGPEGPGEVEVLAADGHTVRMLNFDDPTLAQYFTIT